MSQPMIRSDSGHVSMNDLTANWIKAPRITKSAMEAGFHETFIKELLEIPEVILNHIIHWLNTYTNRLSLSSSTESLNIMR